MTSRVSITIVEYNDFAVMLFFKSISVREIYCFEFALNYPSEEGGGGGRRQQQGKRMCFYKIMKEY